MSQITLNSLAFSADMELPKYICPLTRRNITISKSDPNINQDDIISIAKEVYDHLLYRHYGPMSETHSWTFNVQVEDGLLHSHRVDVECVNCRLQFTARLVHREELSMVHQELSLPNRDRTCDEILITNIIE